MMTILQKLHSSVICVICAVFLTGYHTLNKCQKEIVDSKCIVSGCYFGVIFYNNNKAQIDTYCASQIEPPKPSGVFDKPKVVENNVLKNNESNQKELKIDEINPKGKIR